MTKKRNLLYFRSINYFYYSSKMNIMIFHKKNRIKITITGSNIYVYYLFIKNFIKVTKKTNIYIYKLYICRDI